MKNKTINLLLVDDDTAFIAFAKQLLDLIPDVKVAAVATSATKAVKLLLERSFDILLLDIDMPLLDGFQLLKQIPHLVTPVDPAVRPLFVVMCSGHNPRPRECFKHGVSHFLEKPLSYDDLVDTFAAYKRRMEFAHTTVEPDHERRLLLAAEADSDRVSPTVFDQITAIVVNDTLCKVYLVDGRVETYAKSLSGFMAFLPRRMFVQINRHACIALRHFLYREGDYVFVARCAERLKLGSRETFPAFYRWYDANYEGRRQED